MRFKTSEDVMRHALALAERGTGHVEPNPAVGAVVAIDDEDGGYVGVGEGWHREFGGPHAEVHALAAAGEAARGATLFVSLEPCCHEGKTPPCTKAILEAGIARVVVGTRDPAPHVDGGGISALEAAGVDVIVGALEAEARALVAPFVRRVTTGRPWVHAKWAMTLDGRIATRTGHSQWISGEESRALVHVLRGRMDAVIVGAGTVRADDPRLTARPPGPRTALRVVMAGETLIPPTSELVRTARDSPVLVFTTGPSGQAAADLEASGVEVLLTPKDGRGVTVDAVLNELGRRGATNVLVEGGSEVLGAFLDAGRIDEVHAFIAPKLVGGQAALPPLAGAGLAEVPEIPTLVEPRIERVGTTST